MVKLFVKSATIKQKKMIKKLLLIIIFAYLPLFTSAQEQKSKPLTLPEVKKKEPIAIPQETKESKPLILPEVKPKEKLSPAPIESKPLQLPSVKEKEKVTIAPTETKPLSLPQVEVGRGILKFKGFEGGLNLKAFPTELEDNEAQLLNNAIWNKFGALGRRKGYTHFPIPDSGIGINGLFRYYQQDGDRYLLVGGDTALYRAKNDSTSFVKIKGGIPTGGDFDFVTYKDQLVASCKNMITIGYDGSIVSNLGAVDTVKIDSIYTLACTTIYLGSESEVWDANKWVGYLWYDPLNEVYPYQYIIKNTDRKIYTNGLNLVKNAGFEVAGDVNTIPRMWQQVSAGGLYFWKKAGGSAGSYMVELWATSIGRQLIKNVQDSTTYNISWKVNNPASWWKVQIRNGADTSQILREWSSEAIVTWTLWSDTFYSGTQDSVWLYVVNVGNSEVRFDEFSISYKYYPYPVGDFLILNWYGVGANIATGTIDSNFTDDCSRQYLYGIPNINWTNHFIEITSGRAKGGIRQIKNLGNLSYVELAFTPNILSTETPTYKIYPQTFWQSHFVEVFRNRLVLASDGLNNNLIYYSDANAWNFPPLNLLATYGSQGDLITGIVALYNDQFGQRASPEDRLLIFKQNNILATDDNWLPYVIATGVGAVAPRSIVNVEGLFVGFAHTTGFYITDGNKVSLISEKIKPFWDNINKSKMNLISAGYYDRHLWISVPYGSSTENDTGLIYNIDNKSWSTASLKASVFANQWGLQDTVKFIWGRPDTGWVCKYGTSDFDNADTTNGIIELSYKSKEITLDDLTTRKRFREFFIAYDKTLPLTLYFYRDFGISHTWAYALGGTGKDIRNIPLSSEIYGKTLSWGLKSRDPNITIGNVQIKYSLLGGL